MFDHKEKAMQPQNIWGGAFMILLGVVYLLATIGWVSWQSIGGFFMVIPLAGVLYSGWCAYQQDGRLSGRVISRLMWGLFPFLFIFSWYLDIHFTNIWPLMLIFMGVTMLLNQGGNEDA